MCYNFRADGRSGQANGRAKIKMRMGGGEHVLPSDLKGILSVGKRAVKKWLFVNCPALQHIYMDVRLMRMQGFSSDLGVGLAECVAKVALVDSVELVCGGEMHRIDDVAHRRAVL